MLNMAKYPLFTIASQDTSITFKYDGFSVIFLEWLFIKAQFPTRFDESDVDKHVVREWSSTWCFEF